jgi:flagellar M-ring protein FliF
MFEFLNRFPPPVRIGILAGVPVLLIVLTLFIGMAIGGSGKKQGVEEQVNKNDVVLYRRMSQQSAGEAAAALDDEKIPFKLVEDGTAITVPKDRADKARVTLAAKNLPKDGDPGFSLFDKSDFISTDFDKKVKLLRAMNGEIRRLVKQLDGVDDAAALVTMPEDSLFQTEKKPVTAAVMVKMLPKHALTPSQIEGLTHLIASSVPGLLTDNVTITDDMGNLLTAGNEQNSGDKEERQNLRGLNMQMSLQRQKESEIERKLVTLLEKVVGPGRSVVRVSLELDFNKRKILNTLRAPVTNNGQPVAINKTEQTETVKGDTNGGTPGTAANVPTYPAIPAAPGGGNEVTKKNLKEQPAFNEERQLVEPSSGNIKRMSIAVLLPDTLSPEAADRIRLIVAAAAGADNARRDQISVERVKFNEDLQNELVKQLHPNGKDTASKKGKAVSWAIVWWVGGGVLLLFLLLMLLRRATRREANPLDTLTASLGGETEALPAFDQQALGGFDTGGAFPGLEMGPGGFTPPDMGQFQQPGAFQQAAYPEPGGYEQGGYANQATAQQQAAGGMFDFLYEVSPDAVAQAFEGEKPATIAGVLASVDPSYAEQVLQYLDPSIQQDVFNRVNSGASLPSMSARMAMQNLRRKLGAGVG